MRYTKEWNSFLSQHLSWLFAPNLISDFKSNFPEIGRRVKGRDRSVWPDWVIFENSWQKSFLLFLTCSPNIQKIFGLFSNNLFLRQNLFWLLFRQLIETIWLLFILTSGHTGKDAIIVVKHSRLGIKLKARSD